MALVAASVPVVVRVGGGGGSTASTTTTTAPLPTTTIVAPSAPRTDEPVALAPVAPSGSRLPVTGVVLPSLVVATLLVVAVVLLSLSRRSSDRLRGGIR